MSPIALLSNHRFSNSPTDKGSQERVRIVRALYYTRLSDMVGFTAFAAHITEPFHYSQFEAMNLVPAREKNAQLVACPICGFNYVHFVAIKVEPVKGDTCWTIRASGIDVRKSGPTGRGTTLTIRFRCENGHVWDSRLRFQRGEIFVTAESVDEFYLEDI